MEGYDCVIVGSGASGGTLAYALSRNGCRVLLVEAGDFVKPPNGHDGADRIGFAQYEYGPSRSLPCVGGPTKFYGAALYRFREMDFQATKLEAGESSAWPLSYAELEPYYSDAETIYRVHGSTAGDPTEPPRTSPYPYPPIPHQGLVKSLVERIEATGVPVAHIPRGLDYREGGKCVLCNTCDAYYCRLDAKMDAEIACIRPALATGNVDLATNTECLRVLLSPDGKRATGVQLRSGSRESTVHADVVVVSAGAMQTPVLLRRSRSGSHPEGIGNAYGCLGRYLCGHSVAWIVLFTGMKPLPPMHTKTFAINSFYGPSEEWPYPQGGIQIVGQLPVADRSAFVRALLARSLLVHCMTEEPSNKESGLTFVGDEASPHVTRAPVCKETLARLARQAVRIFRRAGYNVVLKRRVLEQGWHGVGSARMGTDPCTSVLDRRSRVHGFENLYVVDASALPSPGAVNTGLTLMAMALRAADDIAGQKAAPQRAQAAAETG